MEKSDREATERSNCCTDKSEVGRRQVIEAKLQDIVEDINNSRKKHTETMTKFKQELEKQVENVYSSVENKLYDIYDSQRPIIDSKLQELYDTLGRIAMLEEEIREFKQSLACLYQDTIQKSS